MNLLLLTDFSKYFIDLQRKQEIRKVKRQPNELGARETIF